MHWIDSIKGYIPYNEQEKKDKEVILHSIEAFDDILTRNNEIAHMTSSAFAVNRSRDKVLMIHHNIYNSWSWTGGHTDGDEDLLYVSAHLHLSAAYLVEADEDELLTVKADENSGVKWIPIDEVDTYVNEPHMQKVYAKLISKIKAYF